MLELNSIAEFSRCHCIGICAVLVPTNLFLTIATMLSTALGRSTSTIYATVGLSILPAIVLLLHVMTWWAIGVVMLPTYILPILAITCLTINAYAAIDSQQMGHILRRIYSMSIATYQKLVTN
jgi:phosphate/sulfate permease